MGYNNLGSPACIGVGALLAGSWAPRCFLFLFFSRGSYYFLWAFSILHKYFLLDFVSNEQKHKRINQEQVLEMCRVEC